MKKIFTLIAVAALACGFASAKAIKVEAPAQVTDPWDSQFFITFGEDHALQEGDVVAYSIDIKADADVDCGGAQWHGAPGAYMDWQGAPLKFTTDWTTTTWTGTAADTQIGAYTIAMNLSQAEPMVYYFTNISVTINGVEVVANGDIEGDDYSCFLIKVDAGEITEVTAADVVADGEGPVEPEPQDEVKAIEVSAPAQVTDPWDSQFFITFGEENALEEGDIVAYAIDIKADAEVDCGGAQWHGAPGAYMDWQGAPLKFTTDWTNTSWTGTAAGTQIGAYTIAMNLSQAEPVVYSFTNISVTINGEEVITNGDLKGDDYSCFLIKLDAGEITEVTAEDVVTGINAIVAAPAKDNRIFNIWGVQVDENYKGIVIRNGKKYIQR